MATHSSVLAWRIPGTGELVARAAGRAQAEAPLPEKNCGAGLRPRASDLGAYAPNSVTLLTFGSFVENFLDASRLL